MLDITIKRIYYRNKNIIKDVRIILSKPGIYGFFGKNGSGKTTFLKSFSKTVSFEGSIKLNNKELSEKKVAWIPTEPFLYEYLTIKEFYDFFSFTTRDLTPLNEKIFEIDDSKLLKECSTGTQKKAFINAVFQFCNYDIYIFDEPFNGLDIEANYILLNKIIDLAKTKFVIISSHIIEIIEPYLNEKYYVSDCSIKRIDDKIQMKNYFINE